MPLAYARLAAALWCLDASRPDSTQLVEVSPSSSHRRVEGTEAGWCEFWNQRALQGGGP